MLTFLSALKIYLAVEPVDMRKSFNGLGSLAEQKLGENPRQGAVFVFVNRDRDRLKLLYWDGTGVWILRSGSKRDASRGQWAAIARSCRCNPQHSRCCWRESI